MRARGALLFAPLLAACEAERPILRLDVPLGPEHQSVVLLVQGPEGPLLRAFAAREGRIDGLVLDLDLGAATTVSALLYRRALLDLDLAEGSVALLPPGSGRALPEPDSAYEASVEGGQVAPFTPPAGPEPRWRALRVPATPCAYFEPRLLPLPPGLGEVHFLLPLGDGVLGAGDGGAFFARRDVVEALGSNERFVSAAQLTAGLFFGASDGAIWQGHLEPAGCETGGGCARLVSTLAHPAPPGGAAARFLDGSPAGDELYSLDDARRVIRFRTGTTAAELYRFPPGYRTRGGHGGIARLADGTVYAGDINTADAVRVTARPPAAEPLPGDECPEPAQPTGKDGISALVRLGGAQVLVGNLCGTVHRYLAGWTQLRPRHLGNSTVRGMAPYVDGFVYVEDAHRVGQFHPDHGFCAPFPEPRVDADLAVRVAVVGEDVAAAGGPANLRWLLRRRE